MWELPQGRFKRSGPANREAVELSRPKSIHYAHLQGHLSPICCSEVTFRVTGLLLFMILYLVGAACACPWDGRGSLTRIATLSRRPSTAERWAISIPVRRRKSEKEIGAIRR